MQRNHLDDAGTRRGPAIARFWDVLVAEPDNIQPRNNIAKTSKPRHNFRTLS